MINDQSPAFLITMPLVPHGIRLVNPELGNTRQNVPLDEGKFFRHSKVMAILKIARMGHPILHKVAASVTDPTSADTASVVNDMLETLQDAGGLGLAAPQVHISKRIVVFFIPEARTGGGPDDIPEQLTVMINPEIELLDHKKELDWEACLSVPELMGSVPRFTKIKYSWTNLDGSQSDRVAEGFHARVVQHECDHLDGVLYPMQMDDLKLIGYSKEIQMNYDLMRLGSSEQKDAADGEAAE